VVRFTTEAEIFLISFFVQIGSNAHVCPVARRPEGGTNHSSSYSVAIKNDWSYISTSSFVLRAWVLN
jgi:hypothetical protein